MEIVLTKTGIAGEFVYYEPFRLILNYLNNVKIVRICLAKYLKRNFSSGLLILSECTS
jgi:hypothetical protein